MGDTGRAILSEILRDVNLSAPSVTALRPLDLYLGQLLGLSEGQVYSISVSKPGNVTKQAVQSKRAVRAKVLVVVLHDAAHRENTAKISERLIEANGREAVILVVPQPSSPPTVAEVVQADGSPFAEALQEAFPDITVREVPPQMNEPKALGLPIANIPLSVPEGLDVPIVVDPRVRRMLRLAIASSRAVMLVGPPGTGKTTLLMEMLREVADDPATFGLSNGPDGVRQVTPEEGWTTRELVGGETIDDAGHLRFRPGHVLDAIRQNEWLILDEANRADMDKIFGGLLTWLSFKPVTLGRASSDIDAAMVRLEWTDEPACRVEGYERLVEGTGEPIRFQAGKDWRLLGTYNALDAQRVFRFGHALGRRFVRIPVPPISAADFRQALRPHLEGLSETTHLAEIRRIIVGLYAAHLDTPPALGPALFLAIPAYLINGLALLDAEEISGQTVEVTETETTGSSSGPELDLDASGISQLLVEAYLLGAGPWLAQMDDAEREAFRSRLITTDRLLTEDQWLFITELLPSLA